MVKMVTTAPSLLGAACASLALLCGMVASPAQAQDKPGIPPNSVLIFEIELVK